MREFLPIAILLVLFFHAIFAIAPEGSVVIFAKGEGGYYCHKIPYLFRTALGTLIAMAEGRGRNGREACDDFSGTDLVFKRSSDGGMTWSSLSVMYSNSTEDSTNVIGNAAPVQDRHTGRIWMPFCRNNEEVWIGYSDDDGVTWSPPTLHPHLTLPHWKWVGLGPPAGLQLSTGRLLIPSYHTTLVKGDGLLSAGHTLLSDDGGASWEIGERDFGSPYLSNECQAVELSDGTVLINARTVTNKRIQVRSQDGGRSFSPPEVVPDLVQPLEGCEGSLAFSPSLQTLFFSIPNTHSLVRQNLTLWRSEDGGRSWGQGQGIDEGGVAYSSLVMDEQKGSLLLLYERAEELKLVFEPDQIVFYKVF